MTHDNKENSMKITYEDAVEQVARIVDEKGRDYVYADKTPEGHCFYFKGEAPSCVVGHWVHALGIEGFESAVKFEESDAPFGASELENVVAERGIDIDIEPDALRFLDEVQMRQDRGETWGAALDGAINAIESGSI